MKCIAIFFILASSAHAADWKLVWSDEFDKDGLPDREKWDYEEGFVRNNEQQYYTRGRRENARIENGVLVIEARKEKYKNPKHDPKAKSWKKKRRFADYTSASLTTRGKHEWLYGRIEVRAKLPSGRGMWPAIWMLGTKISGMGWPACGEIDIMENVGHNPDTVHATVHTAKYNHTKGTQKGAKKKIEKPYEKFHVYAVEWYRDRLDFFVDKTKIFTFRNEGTGNDAWPFDKKHYLILNIAVGGSWGGSKGIDKSIFPQKFLIDYVRVYEKADKTQ